MRERTSLWLMLYGVYLHNCCRSLTRASRASEPLLKRSHVAVWHWVQRLAPTADRFDVDRRRVGCILVAYTRRWHASGEGVQAWVWAAFEPRLRCFLALRVSWLQSSYAAQPLPPRAQGQVRP